MNDIKKAPNWLLILVGIVLAVGGIVYWGAPGGWAIPGTGDPLIAWPVGICLFFLGVAITVVGMRR